MTEKQCDHLIDYYNGHLTAAEKQKFEQHLNNCADCKQELAEWEQLTEGLAFQAVPVEPPAGMKERILSTVLKEEEHPEMNNQMKTPRKRNYLLYSTAAALFISVLGNIILLNSRDQKEPITKTTAIDKVVNYVSMQPVDGEAAGTASFIKTGNKMSMVIQASKLKPLKGNEVYQVWLLKGNKPYRAGTFVSSGKGEGTVVFPMDQLNGESWETVAITLEPNKNSETPKGTMVLKSSL